MAQAERLEQPAHGLRRQQALRGGLSVEEVHEATGIDPWFLDQMALIEGDFEKGEADGTVDALTVIRAAAEAWRRAGRGARAA